MALRSLHNWDAGRAGFPADPTLLANGACGQILNPCGCAVRGALRSPRMIRRMATCRARPTF